MFKNAYIFKYFSLKFIKQGSTKYYEYLKIDFYG